MTEDHAHPPAGPTVPLTAIVNPVPTGHPHHPTAGPSRRQDQPRGFGQGQIVFLDAFAGIAGDMTVAALVDLGVPFSVVEDAVERLHLPGVSVALERVMVGAIGASRFTVGISGQQPARDYRAIDRLLVGSELTEPVRALARRIFQRLADAEAQVHRVPVDHVHFHEVGAIDSIVDVVGAVACFDHLQALPVGSPLPMGRGFVTCQHGVLPLPAPATVLCLQGVPTHDAGIEAELVTPTGAAILATVADRFARWPSFAPGAVGWGAGTRTLGDRPNVLRVVLGRETGDGIGDGAQVVLAANVDDLTGELAGHAIEALMEAGALDAWAVPITMKKGRPGLTLCALGKHAESPRLAEVLLRETSTIGVRIVPASRVERPRRVITITTPFGDVAVKVSEGPYGPPQIKPEFSDCAHLAAKCQVPVREVLAAALGAARAALLGRD